MSKQAHRRAQSLLLMATLFILWASIYLQYEVGLQPCPLCLVQRFCAILFAVMCFGGMCLSKLSRSRVLTLIQMLIALAGVYFAARQVWLQSLPKENMPACLPGFDILIHYFPWQDILLALFWGSGECAEVTWTLLGLSLPAWALLYFIIMFLGTMVLFFKLESTKT